jgi:hypothetical protein
MFDDNKFSVVSLEDLGKLSKPLTKLIKVCAAGLGRVYRPMGIIREAKARAEEIRIIADAKADAKLINSRSTAAGKVIEAHALQLVSDINERALLRRDAEAVREQENLELIAATAAKYLRDVVSDDEVNEDWIALFFRHARDVSDDTMREVWAQILAGEVTSPGSYSLRTLDAVRLLTRAEATVFSRLCALLWHPNFVVKLQNKDDFSEYGVTFEDVLMLQAAGLLQDSLVLAKTVGQQPPLPHLFRYRNRYFQLVAKEFTNIPAHILTSVGQELSALVEVNPNEAYLSQALKAIQSTGVEVTEGRVTVLPGGGTLYQPIDRRSPTGN